MGNASPRRRTESDTSHELIERAKALIARAHLVHEASELLVAHARHLGLPVLCHRCGATLYWKGDGPPYSDALCDRCSRTSAIE
jgi:hypothetical protein